MTAAEPKLDTGPELDDPMPYAIPVVTPCPIVGRALGYAEMVKGYSRVHE